VIDREHQPTPVVLDVRARRPPASSRITRDSELRRFDAWNARIELELFRSFRALRLPRRQLDQLCAAHLAVKRLVRHLSEVPSTQDSKDLERAWRDLERAWAAVRTARH
jgi:hypothetical protein